MADSLNLQSGIVNPLRKGLFPALQQSFCESRDIHIAAGILLAIAGAIGVTMTAMDVDAHVKAEQGQPAKQAITPKARGALNITFAVLVLVAGLLFVKKGYCDIALSQK